MAHEQVYGCDPQAFLQEIAEPLHNQGLAMFLTSMLSDVQEQVAQNDQEGARQAINRIKLLIREHLGPESAPAQVEATPDANGVRCSVCGEWQRSTPAGMVCKNGHGGAPGYNARVYSQKAVRALQFAVPAGWQLVRQEPTEEMLMDLFLTKAWDVDPEDGHCTERDMTHEGYKLMLQKHPAPQAVLADTVRLAAMAEHCLTVRFVEPQDAAAYYEVLQHTVGEPSGRSLATDTDLRRAFDQAIPQLA